MMVIKTAKELDEELCNYCPLTKEGPVSTNQYNLCEGSHCKEAYERYLEEVEEEC